ncbi:MAG: BamA/TamA family outer membrane protein [Candidatus Zhuqueibacterota bacterium]
MQSVQLKQVVFLVLLLLGFFIIFGIIIYTSTARAEVSEETSAGKKKVIEYAEVDVTIEDDEVIEGDIIIRDGSLSISGDIYGDVIAFNAIVNLDSNASIYGHVVNYMGKITRHKKARIAGDIVHLGNEIEVEQSRDFTEFEFNLTTFEDNVEIYSDTTITGDIVLLDSDITISGKVDGDVINILGDIILTETGAIDGHVINYKGKIETHPGALVTGRNLILDHGTVQADSETEAEEEAELQERIEKKYLKKSRNKNSDIFRFMGDVTIEKDELIRGDVVAFRGTVTVEGEVDGDVVAIFGNVELDSAAYVDGEVVSVGGKVFREDGAYVSGDMVQTSLTGVKVDNADQHVSERERDDSGNSKDEDDWDRKKRRNSWDKDFDDEPFMFRYNRVEGLFLGLRIPQNDWHDEDGGGFHLFGHAGYGFAGKRGSYQIGFGRGFFDQFGFSLGVEAHDMIETDDKWIMQEFENSLAAMLIKEDFHDFYRREGYSLYASQNITQYLRVSAEYRKDIHHNLEKNTNWSLFGGKKKFRENPAIDEIDFMSLIAKITIDSRDDYKYPDQGWLITLSGEYAGKDFNDNGVNFDRFIVDVRRYQPLSYGENLNFRIRAGSSRGVLPQQYLFDLGGISTLPGYKFKEFENHNRMVLGNLEYQIRENRNPINDFLAFDDMNLIIFASAGYVWSVENTDKATHGFKSLVWDDLYTDVGVALCNRDGNVRLNIAKRMDEHDRPVIVTFRISRPF